MLKKPDTFQILLVREQTYWKCVLDQRSSNQWVMTSCPLAHKPMCWVPCSTTMQSGILGNPWWLLPGCSRPTTCSIDIHGPQNALWKQPEATSDMWMQLPGHLTWSLLEPTEVNGVGRRPGATWKCAPEAPKKVLQHYRGHCLVTHCRGQGGR